MGAGFGHQGAGYGPLGALVSGAGPLGYYDIQMQVGGTATAPDGSTNSNPVTAGWVTQTSTTARLFPDSTGAYQTYASGVLSRNDLGIWNRAETRTNGIRNSIMNGAVAGSPGTLPTGTSPIAWTQAIAIPAGITQTIATGTDATLGLPYIEFNYAGVAGSTLSSQVRFGNTTMMGCLELKTAVVSAGGANYAVGDIITLNSTGGTSQLASTVQVLTLSGSAVATVAIVQSGYFTVAPTLAPMTQASTTGVGTGATFTVTYGQMTVVASCWMCVTHGTLGRFDAPVLNVNYATDPGGANAGSSFSSDRVMNRDTTPVQKKVVATPTIGTAARTNVCFQFTFTSGNTYDITIRLIQPQVERIASALYDCSWPIPTTNAAVTHNATVTSLAAAPLAYGPATGTTTLELTTNKLTASGIDWAVEKPLITVNGTTNVLKRGTNGEILSEFLTGPTTYRKWRSCYGWLQTHAVQWDAGHCTVASTAPLQVSPTAAGVTPAVTTVQLTVDGCINRLKVYKTLISLASYLTKTAQVVVWGASSGGVVRAARAKQLGLTSCIFMRFREVQPGGMSAGGLGALDASSLTNFGSMCIDLVDFTRELVGGNPLHTIAVTCLQRDALKYFDYLIRTYQIELYPTRPAASTVGGISSVVKDSSTKRITSFTTASNQVVSGTYFADWSYEGDLMAKAGVTYAVGREAQDSTTDANGLAKNPQNGNRGTQGLTSSSGGEDAHQFLDRVQGGGFANIIEVYPFDGLPGPAVLVSGIQADTTTSIGAVDTNSCQAYNFRQWITVNAANRIAFPNSAPSGYDVKDYELLGRYIKAYLDKGETVVSYLTALVQGSTFSLASFLTFNGSTVSGFYDLNNLNGFSSDWIGKNWGVPFQTITGSTAQQYCEASYTEQATFWTALKNYILGYWYYLQYDCLNEQAVLTCPITAGGASYVVNDYVSCVMANQLYPLVLRVTTVSAGAITGVQICSGAIIQGQALPANPIAQTTTSGIGTGATFSPTWGNRIPAQINTDALLVGLDNATWATTYCEEDPASWMPEFYCREGRRMVGQYVLNQSDVNVTIGLPPLQGTNSAGAGSYGIDSHHIRRLAYTSSSRRQTGNEGTLNLSRVGLNNYFIIPYECLIPVSTDCTNLTVGFCASTNHTAFGGLRMELALMATGEFCAFMDAQLIANGTPNVQSFSPYYAAARAAGLAAGLIMPQTN